MSQLDLIDPRRKALDGYIAPEPSLPVSRVSVDQTPPADRTSATAATAATADPITPLGTGAPAVEPGRTKAKRKRAAPRDNVVKATHSATESVVEPGRTTTKRTPSAPRGNVVKATHSATESADLEYVSQRDRKALDGYVAPEPSLPVSRVSVDQIPPADRTAATAATAATADPITPLGTAPSVEPGRTKTKRTRAAPRDNVVKATHSATVSTAPAKKPMFSIGKTVKPPAVMAFSRQLSSFLEAGIPVLEALEIVGLETGSPTMRAVIADIRLSIQRGSSFVGAVDKHADVFPAYYRAMLMSAEFTGHLDEVLSLLAGYIERDITARRQIKSALSYPTMVLGLAVVAMIVMSIFVLPKFSGLYRSLGADLPLPTRMLIGFTDAVTNYWPMMLGSIAIVVVLLIAIVGGNRGKGRRDVIVMKLPLVGHLFHLISLERFCRVLSALANAGAPLPDAITVSADSTNNSIFQARMLAVRETLIRGSGLYKPMVASGIFPLAARQMIQVGEKTGSLGDQLAKAANYYEREVAFKMKKATEMFQPMVILFVGLVVGFVAVAQVAAMYSIFGQVE